MWFSLSLLYLFLQKKFGQLPILQIVPAQLLRPWEKYRIWYKDFQNQVKTIGWLTGSSSVQQWYSRTEMPLGFQIRVGKQ